MANIFAQMDSGQAPGSNAGAPPGNAFATMDAADNPDAQPRTWGDIGQSFGAGVEEGLTGLAGLGVKAAGVMADPMGSLIRTVRPVLTGKPELDPFDPATATHQLNTSLGSANPENIKSVSFPEKLARGAGQALPAVIAPGEAGYTVGGILKNLATTGAVVTGMTGAGEVVPDEYKPIAEAAAGLVTAAATHGVGKVAGMASDIATDAAAPLIARISPTAAAKQAAKVLANRSTDVATVRDMLSQGPQEIVPGSQPTTFQQTGDVGLGTLERETAVKNPEIFAQRRGEQNAARTAAIGNIQSGANPADVASALTGQFRQLDADTSAHLDSLMDQAKAKAATVGGEQAPEAYGAATRAAVTDAEDAARAREKGLWQAVDPHGDLTGNMTQTAGAAKEITGALPKTAKPMAGEEAAIFDAASSLPAVAPVNDLIALRSRVSTEMRNELIANGRSPSYARLTQLRGAVQDNLATTISQKVANEAGEVSRGTLAPEQSTAARIQGWVDDYRQRQSAEAGNAGGQGAAAVPAAGAVPNDNANGAGTAVPEGSGGAGGAEGLPGDAGQPTFDEAAADRLATATAATKERARTFGINPVSAVLNKAGASDLFRLPEAKVPEKFFHPGPTGYTDMQALYKAVGADPATPLVQDYAASTLRRAAMRDDGTIDPAKFAKWQAAHADALRALPAVARAQFANAAAAAQAVADITRLRETALKDAQAGAIGRVMGAQNPEDATRIIGNIFGTKTATAEMGILARAVAKDPLAKAGLRQAIVDHIAQKFISNAESATSGINQIKNDQFQTFMKTSGATLRQVFTPAEVKNLEAVAEDIRRSRRSESAIKLPGGSNTAQDLAGIKNHDLHTSPAKQRFIDIVAATVGHAFGGAVGAMAAGFGADAIQQMRESGIDRVDQLVTKAMLDPAIAHELLKRVPLKENTGSATSLAKALRRATYTTSLVGLAKQGSQPSQQASP